MSQGVTHFAVGAALTTALVAFLVPDVRYPRVWVLVGGGWAMVPDAVKLYRHPVLVEIHGSHVGDLFWFHYTLDRLDSADSTLLGAASIAALIAATALAERRGYRALTAVRKRGENADDGSR